MMKEVKITVLAAIDEEKVEEVFHDLNGCGADCVSEEFPELKDISIKTEVLGDYPPAKE